MEDCDGEVRPVLVSLAMSYTDVKDYDSALSYYERELHYCHGNPQEVSFVNFVHTKCLLLYVLYGTVHELWGGDISLLCIYVNKFWQCPPLCIE